MLAKSTPEFDAFGPWLYCINDIHTLPPLFSKYKERLKDTLICIKIPRQIERREANPEMNLYDAVLGVFTDKVIFLEREEHDNEDRVKESSILISQINCIYKNTCLLSGTLTLITDYINMEIQYNTVSEDIISTLVNTFKKIIPRGKTENSFPVLPYNPKNMEFNFVKLADALRCEDKSLNLIGYQHSLKYAILKECKWGILKRFNFREHVTSGFIVLCNDKELVVVQRIFYQNRPSSEKFANKIYYLPFDSLKEIKLVLTEWKYPGLEFATDKISFVLPFESWNESLSCLYSYHLPEIS